MTPEPLPLLAAWTGGTAAGTALLLWWEVGRPGFGLLNAAMVASGLGMAIVVGAPGPAVVLATTACVAAMVLIRRRPAAAILMGLVAVCMAPYAFVHGVVTALGESVLLGSVTLGLSLGHWFLIDPHLPRRPLRIFAAGGLIGLAVTVVSTVAGPSHHVVPYLVPVMVVTAATTAVVLVAAIASLSVPTYKGVQSATGLFYISIMTVGGFVLVAAGLRGVG